MTCQWTLTIYYFLRYIYFATNAIIIYKLHMLVYLRLQNMRVLRVGMSFHLQFSGFSLLEFQSLQYFFHTLDSFFAPWISIFATFFSHLGFLRLVGLEGSQWFQRNVSTAWRFITAIKKEPKSKLNRRWLRSRILPAAQNAEFCPV